MSEKHNDIMCDIMYAPLCYINTLLRKKNKLKTNGKCGKTCYEQARVHFT